MEREDIRDHDILKCNACGCVVVIEPSGWGGWISKLMYGKPCRECDQDTGPHPPSNFTRVSKSEYLLYQLDYENREE